ncbi:hypothetical protein [Halorientalis litorea]|jgi:hypothetical protein|uniref:hypothetical protein n=1 Tax=Halorientalis litorea TaxID=2931977 RepID=UPI001FF41092|nr:hypothetical protein [Halorientalis litorea]
MKSGASDPFADDEQSEDTADESMPERPSETVAEESEPPTGDSESAGLSREELPFVLRRERVKDERPEVHQLFVQADTHERAVDAERELESRLDRDLARTDAREAIYLAGMAHLDDAEAVLREWGYDL